MRRTKYKIKCLYPPCISHHGNRYYISGGGGPWIECKSTTTLEDIEWEPLIKIERPTPTSTDHMIWEVMSSSGREYYKVEKNGDTWLCSCPGFHWRGACKHTRLKQQELSNENKN
jgi:hypothetical protein